MRKLNPYRAKLVHSHQVNRTQEKLIKGYLAAYRHHGFSLVTIKEICQAVGVARSTFYRYFDNTVDLRNLIEDNFVAGLLKSSRNVTEADLDSPEYMSGIKSMIAFLQKNREVFNLLLVERPSRSFMDKYTNSIYYEYYYFCHEDTTNLAILAGGLIGFFRYRLSQDLPLDDPDVMSDYAHIERRIIDAF